MNFYHYNTNRLPDIRSLLAQNKARKEDQVGSISNYSSSVSLFTYPIPRDIASIYEKRHEFYKPGLVLYEHVISSRNIPNDIQWKLLESPEKTDLLYHKQDWDSVTAGDPRIAQYKKEIQDMEVKMGYIGKGLDDLIKLCQRFKHDLSPYMVSAVYLAKKHGDEEDIFSKYAALVPHVAIYAGMKPLTITEVSAVKIK